MSIKRTIHILGLAFLLFSVASCKKWVEVSPKTQIEDLDFYGNEQGFKEALNGVYLLMGRPAQYGRELTFGLADVLGGMYVLNTSNGSLAYRDAFAGLYTNAATQNIINSVWANQYNAIANVNKLLQELERADTTKFLPKNYHIIKGEALGLRAFLHFDLLRLFGTSYAAGGASLPAIPYLKTYATTVTGKASSAEVMQMIFEDVTKATEELKNDPLLTGETITTDMDNGYLMNRSLRFNYYAVKALEARAQLWVGATDKALPAAEAVIAVAGQKFAWVAQSTIATSNEAARNRVFTTEHIFGLFVNDMALNYTDLLDSSRFQTTLTVNSSRLTQQFESGSIGAADYRLVYLIRNLSNLPTPKIFFGKLYQPNGMTEAYAKRMPLIRIPEMYYIAAECLKTTDPAKATSYLTAVRASRGVTAPLSASLTADQIQEEIRKEYWKEFPSEGQLFFYFKRRNGAAVPGVNGTYPSARYVLPLPPAELEFGF